MVCCNTSRKNKDKTFHGLPKDKAISDAWIKAINRSDKLPKAVFLYSDHFEESCYNLSWTLQNDLFYKNRPCKRRLLPGAIPTPFDLQRTSKSPRIIHKTICQKNKSKKRYVFFFYTFFFKKNLTICHTQNNEYARNAAYLLF